MSFKAVKIFNRLGGRLRRFPTPSSALVALALLATSVAAAGPPPNSPADPARPIWNMLLTPCGPSYFYAGSFFDRGGMLSVVGAGNNPNIYEFRGVKFNTVPVRVTDAERLNGLEYHARMTMIAHVYREAGGAWTDGPDLQARNTDDIMGLALQSVGGDMGQLGIGGSMAFDLAKAKGKWISAALDMPISVNNRRTVPPRIPAPSELT